VRSIFGKLATVPCSDKHGLKEEVRRIEGHFETMPEGGGCREGSLHIIAPVSLSNFYNLMS
jgi:hypothetical protein